MITYIRESNIWSQDKRRGCSGLDEEGNSKAPLSTGDFTPMHALSEVALFRNALCGRRRLQGLCPRTTACLRSEGGRPLIMRASAIVHSASMPSSQPSRLPTGRKELERDSWAMNTCGQLRNAAVGIETSWS